MKVASVADVKAKLSSYLDASANGPVVVTRNGKAVAVLLGVRDDDELERLILAHSPKLNAILDAAERRIKEGKGISHEEIWKRVESSKQPRKANGSVTKRKTRHRKS
jgi:prevent-host-death family protein